MAPGSPQSTTLRALPRDAHRLATRVEGEVQRLATLLLASAERLAVALACDARHDAELRRVRLALSEVVAVGNPAAANWARVGLVHLGRAEAHDADEDAHVSITCRLLDVGRRVARAIGGAIELALVGRSAGDAREGTDL